MRNRKSAVKTRNQSRKSEKQKEYREKVNERETNYRGIEKRFRVIKRDI